MANPLFGHRARDEVTQQLIARLWDSAPSNPFIGGWQPLAPGKNPPSLLSVDSPPGYAWELVTFDAEDQTIYFRAQRWPAGKIIVSIDNPPAQDDERAALQSIILRAWEPQTYPQQRRYKQLPVVAATATGDISSTGSGTGTFVGSAAAAVPISSVATSTAAWVGTSQQNTAPKKLLQTHIIRAWDIPASIVQRRAAVPQVTATSATGDLRSIGTATDIWIGSAAGTGTITAPGVATAAWVGSSAQNTAPRAVIQGQIIAAWVPQQLLLQPRRFLPQVPAAPGTGALSSLGVGLATWTGAESATASFLGIGQSTAVFVGRSSAATSQRFDGWRTTRELLERRRRKDEQEIMTILEAVLPLVQSGTVSQPTRFSVPRKAGTLH